MEAKGDRNARDRDRNEQIQGVPKNVWLQQDSCQQRAGAEKAAEFFSTLKTQLNI